MFYPMSGLRDIAPRTPMSTLLLTCAVAPLLLVISVDVNGL